MRTALAFSGLLVACASDAIPPGSYKVTAEVFATGDLSCTDLSSPEPEPTQGGAFLLISTRDGGVAYVQSSAPSASPPDLSSWFDDSRGGWSRATANVMEGEAPAPYCEMTYQTLTASVSSSALHLDVRSREDTSDDTSDCTTAAAIARLRDSSLCLQASVWDAERFVP